MNDEKNDKIDAIYRELCDDDNVFGLLVIRFQNDGTWDADVVGMNNAAMELMAFYRREFTNLLNSKQSLDRLAAHIGLN